MQLNTEENQDHISGGAEMSSEMMSNEHLYWHILNTVIFLRNLRLRNS